MARAKTPPGNGDDPQSAATQEPPAPGAPAAPDGKKTRARRSRKGASGAAGQAAQAAALPEEKKRAQPKKRKPAGEPPKRRGRPSREQELRQEVARPGETERALALLEQLVDTFGGSRRRVDRLLGTGRSRTSQILSRRLDLKFQHILDILEALGIESKAFFEVLYAEEGSAPFPGPLAVVYRQKVRALGAPEPAATPSEPAPLPPLLTEDDVRRLIDSRLTEAFGRALPKKPEPGGGTG
ncbi:MAG TPA: hypothetical protein VN783_05755 [Thermoanaerobaculia bacterium]|nr:hypothetical protein [Thermoanaerobaculia bacterium]